MAVKVYVDVLFLTNMIFDYILLCFAALFTKSIARPFRLLCASAVGAAAAVIAFFTAKNTAVIISVQLFTSSVMIILAFGIKDFFGCIRMSAVLYVCAFTLGGACLYLVKSDGVIMSGGAFYFDISTPLLFAAGILTYILSSISYGVVLKKRANAKNSCKITIENDNKSVTLEGFYDTGNTAKDENGRGIIFASEEEVLPVLVGTEEINTVCVRTVGGELELKCFVPDKVYSDGCRNTCRPKRKIAFFKSGAGIKQGVILPHDFFDYN